VTVVIMDVTSDSASSAAMAIAWGLKRSGNRRRYLSDDLE
jgi:hypothetical protein